MANKMKCLAKGCNKSFKTGDSMGKHIYQSHGNDNELRIEIMIEEVKKANSDLVRVPKLCDMKNYGFSCSSYTRVIGEWDTVLEMANIEKYEPNSVCEYCESEYYVSVSKLDSTRWCSSECRSMWESENRSGENHHYYGIESHEHPNWKDGNKVYGNGWNRKVKDTVKDRDNNKCINCGISNKSHIEKFDSSLEVHHLVNPRNSSNPAVHNAPRNLITLCKPCHRTWEVSKEPKHVNPQIKRCV